MKKTVKPSPIIMIFFGILAAICILIVICETTSEWSLSFENALLCILVIGVFAFFFFKFFSQKKIEFDENSFTVGEKTYGFDEITNVTVNSEQILRSVSTLRVKLYIGENEIASFTKDDKCGKDFIAVMKNNGVKLSIET